MAEQAAPGWSEAWLDALHVLGRIPRSGASTRKGLVQDLQVEPGRLAASVDGTVAGTELNSVCLGLRVLDDTEWRALLERITTKVRLTAALLAGEVPLELQDVLLPEADDLSLSCTCSDTERLCRHAVALCHAAAEVFDTDPFALFLLRGRARAQVVTQLRKRRAEVFGLEAPDTAESKRPRGTDPGMSAASTYRRKRSASGTEPAGPSTTRNRAARQAAVPPFPVPARARPLAQPAAPPPADSGIKEDELRDLVADGARRAAAMLAGEADSGLGLSVGADVARRAIVGDVHAIATATNLPADELAAAAQAFHHGQQAGLAVARGRWDAPPERLAPGVDALQEANTGAKPVTRANTVSLGGVQLRLDQEGIWWRFEADDELGWLPPPPRSPHPTDLV